MVLNFSEGCGPLYFACKTKFNPAVAYDPHVLAQFNKWVLENWQKPLPTPPGGSPPKNHHALVHEVRRPIPVIGREIPPPQNYGKEPPPTGFEPDNDEGFGEQMDVDEDFLPPPPPPSPPHVVLRPIGYGRPQQRPATSMTYLPFPQAQAPQPLYLLPLPRAPQQQFNIQPPNPQMLAQLFRFLTPAGHAHWQHPMQNPVILFCHFFQRHTPRHMKASATLKKVII